jgi:hypothetical protein
MSTNPLKVNGKTHSGIPFEKNPLENPVVAREWAGIAIRNGKPDLAEKWAEHARKLEAGR